ncbi:MAG: IreB family regulatory phosphoprotein [Clostridia bacterium]|nr:IreB family regulatory phosphoprotein [Clostridia bacterium]
MANDKDTTITFQISHEKELETKQALRDVYQALKEKGYNPINQIVGYILSEDPTYITNYKNARGIIRKIDRDELLNILVRSYLNKE